MMASKPSGIRGMSGKSFLVRGPEEDYCFSGLFRRGRYAGAIADSYHMAGFLKNRAPMGENMADQPNSVSNPTPDTLTSLLNKMKRGLGALVRFGVIVSPLYAILIGHAFSQARYNSEQLEGVVKYLDQVLVSYNYIRPKSVIKNGITSSVGTRVCAFYVEKQTATTELELLEGKGVTSQQKCFSLKEVRISTAKRCDAGDCATITFECLHASKCVDVAEQNMPSGSFYRIGTHRRGDPNLRS